MSVLTDLNAWVQWALIVAALTTIGVVARALARRWLRTHTADQVDHAASLSVPIAGSLALLIGFAITITWGGISAGQSAVEAQAVAARQVGWNLELEREESSDQLAEALTATIVVDLVRLLREASAPEAYEQLSTPELRNGIDEALRRFQLSVRQLTYDPKISATQAASIQSAADSLAAAAADSLAIARRHLPDLLLVLILLNAALLSVLQGIALVNRRHPWGALAWAGIVALSITVVLQMDAPFSGAISVDRDSLSNVASWLSVDTR
jgi:hypothetical protein